MTVITFRVPVVVDQAQMARALEAIDRRTRCATVHNGFTLGGGRRRYKLIANLHKSRNARLASRFKEVVQ